MTKPVVAVDFDGVIASWDSGTFLEPGKPISGARAFLEYLSEFGKVTIYTCRCNSELYDGEDRFKLCNKIWDWLEQWDMVDFVSNVHIGQGKPYAACYIDDKAVECDPEHYGPAAFAAAIVRARALCCNGRQYPNKGGVPCQKIPA